MNYTQEQKNIFNFIKNGHGSAIVDAVAGAGKTTTIIESARFIDDHSRTLFCAFNNSIAKEIAKRFRAKSMNTVTVKTIHSLGYNILKSNLGNNVELNNNKYRELIKRKDFERDVKETIKNIIKINQLDPLNIFDKYQKYAIDRLVWKIKNKLLEINQKFRSTYTKENFFDFESMILHFNLFNEVEVKKDQFKNELKAYYNLHKILLEYGNKFSGTTGIVDFTDMLYLPIKWKLKPPKVYNFVFVDECQDLSKSQLGIVLKYTSKTGRMLSVGDPRQSIYGFTGADIESFRRVKEKSNANELALTLCFRCPKDVIEIAKTIRSDIQGAKDYQGEVKQISSNDILRLAKPNDLIISRTKSPLLELVFEFIDNDIKVSIHEDEVKEIISELKIMFKQNELTTNINSFNEGFELFKMPILKRVEWLIKKNAERIIDKTERDLFINDEISFLHKKINFLQKKHSQWNKDCNNIYDVLEKVHEFITNQKNAIKLSTIHRAKGLEENRVFILNYDELPMIRPSQLDWEITQEINLKYVAVTRAKETLFLVASDRIDKTINEDESMFDEAIF